MNSPVSIAAGYGSLTTWCISGSLPVSDLCRPLYIAQQLDTAPGVPGEYYAIYSVNQARDTFGAGSIAAQMVVQHFASCPELPVYVAPYKAAPGATAAAYTMTLAGTSTSAGVLSIAIMDQVYSVPVAVGTTADDVADALADALNANADLGFTAAAAAGVVTLTAKNKGMQSNTLTPVLNPNIGDTVPAGLTYDFEQTVVAAGVTPISDVLPVFACCWDCIAVDFEDVAALNTLIAQVDAQWACPKQSLCFGHVFYGKTGTPGTLAAFGHTRNDATASAIPVPPEYKYPSYLFSAAMASRVCCTACTDPAIPVQYENGVLGSLYDSRMCSSIWAREEKRALRDAGMVIWDVASAVGIRNTSLVIEEPLTTYKTNPLTGARDLQWERVEYRYETARIVKDLNRWYRANYSAVSLVSDGTRIPQGRRAVSPRILEASIKAYLRSAVLGYELEGSEDLEGVVVVTRPVDPRNCDASRLDVALRIDLVNQLARIVNAMDVSPQYSCLPATAAA